MPTHPPRHRLLYFLFPLVFLFHMNEEYAMGFTYLFPFGQIPDPLFFFGTPLLFGIITAVGVLHYQKEEGSPVLALCFPTILLANSLFHAGWSLITNQYQPGLYSSLLFVPLWLIWIILLARKERLSKRIWLKGISAGIVLMVGVILLASFLTY